MVFFDTDHDQCLSLTEFRSCVTGLGLVMTEEQITAKMTELDKTGDGRLNFDEFAQFMAVQLSEPGRTLADIIAAFRELAEEKAYLPQVRVYQLCHHTVLVPWRRERLTLALVLHIGSCQEVVLAHPGRVGVPSLCRFPCCPTSWSRRIRRTCRPTCR
jgi:hypothetical protein